jgi:YVTN family beta-propeller protein
MKTKSLLHYAVVPPRLRTAVAGGLWCALIVSILSSNAYGAFGDVVATYPFPASAFVISPTQPNIMYATVPSQNSVAIINTNTLTYETAVVGSGPTSIALSPDGLTAYIANSSSSFVAVFDTQTRTVTNSFLIAEAPQDVVFANQNRLFVLTANHIYQIDATTGASTGPNVTGVYIYGGSLEISPDRNTLYYGEYGGSPSTMYQIDISGVTPALLRQTQTGSNGEDLTLSKDGNFICHPNGAPYQIAKYRTSDFASLGSFNTGAYPQALGFSPDGLVAYASVHTQGGIKVFDANSFLPTGTITGPEVASKLAVDSSGRYLFAGYTVYYSSFLGTKVYDTGRGGPTPTPSPTPTPCPACTPTPTPTPTVTPTPGNFGTVAATYSFPASAFATSLMHPEVMYATIPSQNSVAIINTNTLAYETAAVGSGPQNLALSPDGLTAYIANSSSSFVAVFDTQTRMVTNSFLMPEAPRDVVFANQNRLFVLTANHIYQIDAITGASTGPSIGSSGGVFIYGGSLKISPDRNTLYYGQQGLSSSSMYKFNISGTTPALVRQIETGENGHDVALSTDGNSVCHPNGYPYQIAKYRTSDFAVLGSFNTGPYPLALGFSPDDLVAYASVDTVGIKAYDANSFLATGMIANSDGAEKLQVDLAGKYLFAGYNDTFGSFVGTKVYNTGRTVPIPSPTPTPTPCMACTPTPTPSPVPTATPTATPIPATPTPTATPTATPSPSPGLVGNVSTRLPVGTGDGVLIEGFIVQGPAGSTKNILVRAIGPSLIPFGITDALANPALEIHDASGATVATNNDWRITQTGGLISGDQSAAINSTGLAPSDDLESAIIANLAPGNYTAVVSGVGNSTGTGVVDAYDISAASPAKLANIATRGFIQPGDQLMIGGFIVQNAPVRAVVRAIGPSLLGFGISNALPDTTLQLRDQNGAIVLENDDWKTNQQQELENTGLQPSHDLEAALVTTIQPGQYTAQVRGKNEASGIGVVQVYFLQ